MKADYKNRMPKQIIKGMKCHTIEEIEDALRK